MAEAGDADHRRRVRTPWTVWFAVRSLLEGPYNDGHKVRSVASPVRKLHGSAWRTPFHVIVGEPFHMEVGKERTSRDVRQRIADEIMYRMATLLPPAYRGEYASLDAATESYLRFDAQSGG
jgi:hypothetical protein